MSILELLRQHGEIARTSTLIQKGGTKRDIAATVAQGSVVRVMKGWVASRQADAEQLTAVRSGGRLGCISALARWGVWAADDRSPHIAMSQHGRRLSDVRMAGSTEAVMHPRAPVDTGTRPRLDRPCCFHWSQPAGTENDLDWIVRPFDAVKQAVYCQNLEHAVACVDSALHHGVLTAEEWATIATALPTTFDECVSLIDGRADSGLESRIRVRLQKLGHRVDVQVPVPGFGKLDLLVDDRVGLELDGDRFHSTADQRRRDLAKGLISLRFGIPIIRAGYVHAIDDWDLVYEALRRMLDLTALRVA
ncbi:endonuclease domain-containing protein [Paramicrobacterium agarici]|uniref:endonuclease domain-containing protein n=1 Tax=Paramicrobacterium agarici TaxID=630514 RepID=UPI0011506C86|nr:hypothetical protein [Microbacterium agarici]TQO21815.1 hypothetical protein FB385_0627 [Microbacterium agarici]